MFTKKSFKEVFCEIYIAFLDGKFLAAKIGKRGFLSLEIKAQLIGIECLMLVSCAPILAVHAVFSVTEQRMPDVRHMCADLMRPSG